MKQTFQFDFQGRNSTEQNTIEKAKGLEVQYKSQIPDEFMKIVQRIPAEIQAEKIKAEEEIWTRVFGVRVKEAYDLLREHGIPAKESRILVTARMIQYRSKKHIERFIPEEAFDPHMSELANYRNLSVQQKKEHHREKLWDSWLNQQPHDVKVELGGQGGEKTKQKFKKEGLKQHSYIGKMGSDISVMNRVDRAIKVYAAEEGIDLQVQQIAIEILPEHAQKIMELCNDLGKAILLVNAKGEILNIYNREPSPIRAEMVEPDENEETAEDTSDDKEAPTAIDITTLPENITS